MKKLFGLLLPLALFSFGAIADGADAEIIVREENLERPVGEVKNVRQLLDEKGIYYAVDVNFSVLPIGAGVAVGYSHEEKVEAEVYAAITAIRLVSESAPHIPYGARVRVALNERKTIYVEYQHEVGVVDFGNKYGLLDDTRMFNIVYKFKKSQNTKTQTSIACGVGKETHHPWRDETHAPERGLFLQCRLQFKF